MANRTALPYLVGRDQGAVMLTKRVGYETLDVCFYLNQEGMESHRVTVYHDDGDCDEIVSEDEYCNRAIDMMIEDGTSGNANSMLSESVKRKLQSLHIMSWAVAEKCWPEVKMAYDDIMARWAAIRLLVAF